MAKDLIDDKSFPHLKGGNKYTYTCSARNLPDILTQGFTDLDQIDQTVESRKIQRQRRKEKREQRNTDTEQTLRVPLAQTRGRQI